MGVRPLPGHADGGGVAAALRRAYPLPVEIALLAAVVVAWQFARVPFEAPLDAAVARSRDVLDVERALKVAIEADAIRWLYDRPGLLAKANWFYSHLDETLVFGVLVAMRLIDPRRYPVVRTAFALTHVPAILVVALLPAAPPRWVPGMPGYAPPTADFTGDLRNSTAALVSLHVGVPAMLAAAAIWMRPRAPLAWATALLPCLVFAVVLGTPNHFVLDALVGIACGALGFAVALLIHGPTPRGRPEAGPLRIAAFGALVAAGAFAVNNVVLALT